MTITQAMNHLFVLIIKVIQIINVIIWYNNKNSHALFEGTQPKHRKIIRKRGSWLYTNQIAFWCYVFGGTAIVETVISHVAQKSFIVYIYSSCHLKNNKQQRKKKNIKQNK